MRELAGLVGPERLLTGEADLASYSYDAALDRGVPQAVVLAESAAEVERVVGWCARAGVPFTARGAGTNLSGGCVPLKGGIVLSLSRMDRILEIDARRGVAVVEPGVVNLSLQKEAAKVGCFYAPDPASYRVSTLGGNAAENAGGPRCLKYGTTTNHVLGLEAVMPTGGRVRFSAGDPGPDLAGLLVGSEGTLGVATRLWLRLTPLPEKILTVLAAFPSLDDAMECASEIVAAGIVPRVLEAMDRTTLEAVEAYSHAGYPVAEAVLLVELDGPAVQVDSDFSKLEALFRARRASEIRSARTAEEREKLWEGRRGAYAAMARIAPNVLVEDGVVPRPRLGEAVRRIQEIARNHRIRMGLLFHAGDGNLHPNMAFDERDLDQTRRTKQAGYEMLQCCIELGGSISGEHGIGVDKRRAMAWLFESEALSLFRRLKAAFDPDGIANPDKILPLPEEVEEARSFRKPPAPPLTPAAQELVRKMGECWSRGWAVRVSGTDTKREKLGSAFPPASSLEDLRTTGLDRILDLDKGNFTVTVEAGIPVRRLIRELKSEGFFLALPEMEGTLGGMLATRCAPGARDIVLGMRILLADGQVAALGGKVVKNVAGYDVPKLLLGSWGALAIILEATLRLYPLPSLYPLPKEGEGPEPFVPNEWHRKLKFAFDPENRLNPWIFGP